MADDTTTTVDTERTKDSRGRASGPQISGKMKTRLLFQSNLLTRNDKHALMDIMSIAFYIIIFVLAFMIARIIMRIMRGY